MEGDNEIRGLPYEYVLQIDGKVKSAYRRFVDALRAGPHPLHCIPLYTPAVKFRFPGTETAAARDLVRMRPLLWRNAEHLVLPGPCGGQVG